MIKRLFLNNDFHYDRGMLWLFGGLHGMRQMKKQKITKITPFRMLVTYYFITVALSAVVLSLPFARKPGADWSFMDANLYSSECSKCYWLDNG